ncbi:putative ABC transporter [Trypanosoma conorhini]|uniref:Putative ABC transporter n=1 Tax=Trypanosoma conorhini TaxID=83891 RepID=A0A3R7NGW2_9TRYP|nr:putative ABC transporter [Trypanosoma conorhini]RNF02504.1 putative ABC transporter [Trypanosoma conorhini]
MLGISGFGLGESTPLVSSEARSHWREATHAVSFKHGGEVRPWCDAAQHYIRSVFRVGGLNICIVEVRVSTDSRLSRCFPRFFPPKLHCESALALMREGGLHVIADVDGVAGSCLLRVITGAALCAAGTVLANGVPVEAGVFRKAVGVVTTVEAYMPNLSVEENINFVVSLRTKVTGAAREVLVEAACVLTDLDRRKAAKLLSPSEAFRLRLAMEIVRDPPVLVAYYPFDHLGPVDASECSAVLKRLTTVLEKTVIISTTTLAAHLFEVTDTLLLLGRGGGVLYSGEAATMPSYFNGLRLSLTPSSTLYGGVGVPRDASPCYSNASTPSRVTVSPSSTRGSSYNEHGTPHISSSLASRMEELRAAASSASVSCGDDALDLATVWAESQSVSAFYTSNYYNSHLRRRLLQTITRYSNPPEQMSDVTPFTSTAPPQYAVLKIFLLWWYDAMQTWRDSEFYVQLAFLSLGLLLILLLLQNQNDDQWGMYNIRGIQFVLFLLTMLANTTTMGDVNHQLRLFFIQRENGLYGTACFMIVFVLRTVFVRVLYLALFIPVVRYMLRMSYTFFLLLGALSVTQVLLHFTVHALVPRNRWALLLLRLYLGYSVIFCGFLLNLTTMPSVVGKTSILRWSYGAALAQRLRDMPFSCDGAGNTSYCYSGNAYLELEGFSDESTERSLVVFAVMCGVLILLAGIALACRK